MTILKEKKGRKGKARKKRILIRNQNREITIISIITTITIVIIILKILKITVI